ncbi:hypothetical protein CYMTET_12200 [Cymbomonas tetramitiformis]|uniref:Uncharacterized protein n=1 Tax=Cymbomonas tetramitiformis TaxID=36881 RepID=A0AAE0GKV7_9CHLO|nr:hypothetical protein CYMTET_12200 [Cymbomonas tetramitiformis]
MGGTWLWGACQVEPVQSEETSNENVAHNISVRVKDAYGETVTSDQTTVVELVFVEPSVCSMQQGSERLLVVDGVANFPGDFGLVLRGNPGLQCQGAHFYYPVLNSLFLEILLGAIYVCVTYPWTYSFGAT